MAVVEMPADEYARLFNARGSQYHAAMGKYPAARDAEFTMAVAVAGVKPGQSVADIPCGGGYLARYLPADVEVFSVDSSDVFADCFRSAHRQRLLQCPITAVPLADASLDHVISVAGLHHVVDRRPFWQECARLLKAGGVLTVADVREGSAVADFLEDTVDRHTVTGHRGTYFDNTTVAELDAAGFNVELVEPRRIPWRATDLSAITDFCRLLFGLQDIDDATLSGVLVNGVGTQRTDTGAGAGVELDWELMFFRAVRR